MQKLSGVVTLVAEDDFFIAVDLIDEIDRAGGSIVGPFPDLGSATRAVTERHVDVAVVDIALRDSLAYPLLASLMQSGIPTVIASAFNKQEIDPRYRSLRILEKPFPVSHVIQALAEEHERSRCVQA